jgi:hypothetical protein
MGECAKQLTDAVAVTGASRVTRCAVRRGDTQRRPGVRQSSKLRIFAQAGQDAAPPVRDDELEGTITRGIRYQAALWSAAVLEDIVHKLTDSTHQTRSQSPSDSRSIGCVLGMLGPLIPDQAIRTVTVRVIARQRENAGSIARAGTTNHSLPKCSSDLVKHRRLNGHSAIDFGQSGLRHRDLDERPNTARPTEGEITQCWQSSDNGLPEQIIRRVETRNDLRHLPTHFVPHPRIRSVPNTCCSSKFFPSSISADRCSVVDIIAAHHRVARTFHLGTSH